MVTYKLKGQKPDGTLVYLYYTKGDEQRCPGVVIANKDGVKVVKAGKGELERDISPKELNQLAEAINELVRERGGTDLAELCTEPEHSFFYGDHVVSDLERKLKEGAPPEKGEVMWY